MPKSKKPQADPVSVDRLKTLNRWKQSRIGHEHARDQNGFTIRNYRDETVGAIPGGKPDGYQIWPVFEGDPNDPEDGTWFQRTIAWDATRVDHPPKKLGRFRVSSRNDIGVLNAAAEACRACWADLQKGAPIPDILETLTGEKTQHPFDPTVLDTHAGRVYLTTAQVYALHTSYRRKHGVAVWGIDSIRRQLSIKHQNEVLTALGKSGARRWPILEALQYVTDARETVESIYGISEKEMVKQIEEHTPIHRRPRTRPVPEPLLLVAMEYLDTLRRCVDTRVADPGRDSELHRVLRETTDGLHYVMGTAYQPVAEPSDINRILPLYEHFDLDFDGQPRTWDDDFLMEAEAHASKHADDVRGSRCGCYGCLSVFEGARVSDWDEEGETALCPVCLEPTVLPASRGLPVDNSDFLQAMHAKRLSDEPSQGEGSPQ